MISKIFFQLLVTVFLTSCGSKKDLAGDGHQIQFYRVLNNDNLEKAIVDYIDATAVDSESEFVTVSVAHCGSRTTYLISKARTVRGLSNWHPDFYCLVKQTVVILRADHSFYLDNSDFEQEFAKFLISKGKLIKDDLPTLFDPPRWVLVTTPHESRLQKKLDPSNFTCNPCEP